jgi:CARDB
MDWMGAYNVYYRCDSSNGAYVTIRSPAPGLQVYLEDQSRGDGLLAPQTRNSSGWRELGMVRRGDYNANNNPVHPDNPGHFTCSEGSSAPATGTVTGAKLPDLAVDTPDIALSRTSIVEGDKVTITATVRNVGTLAASNVSVRFTDGRNEIGTASIGKINAGSSGKASVTWETRDWENLNGDEVIVVLADFGETIAERDEQNNEGRKIVDVIASKTPNGSFEVSTNGTAPDGWTPVGTTAWVEGGTDGARSVTVAAPPAGWSSAPIPVAAGTAYSIAVKVTHTAASVKVDQLDAAGNVLASTTPPFGTVSSGLIGSKVFYTRQGSFTAVAGATQVRVVLAGAVSTTPTTFDDIRVW